MRAFQLVAAADGLTVRPRTWLVNRGSRTFVATASQIALLGVLG